MKTMLVFGRAGQVAGELARMAVPGWRIEAFGRETLDLTTGDIASFLAEHAPDAVINASAYTAVDKAEGEADAAYALNRDAPGAMARACAARALPFVHISTDYVFDGSKPAPYVEDDPIAPLGVYGASKAAGEAAVEAAGGRWAILRTSWVYSPAGANFVKTMIRVGQARDELGVVDDQHGRPTSAREVAEAAVAAVLALESFGPADGPLGVLHIAGGGDATWADLAEEVFVRMERRTGKRPVLNRISTADYPTPAKRPVNSRLDGPRALALLGWRPKPWRESLAQCLDEIEESGGL
jgi:dTDP-4-dehydrorhamnose reductase